MVGGRLRCLSCFFTYGVALLFGVSLHDVEASGQRTIHKEVGDTVEFPTCLPSEGVISADWKYRTVTSAGKSLDITKHDQFKGRFDINSKNYSLTVRKLTVQDSGEFQFVSEVKDVQRETVSIILQVHEPITEQPVLKPVNNTWDASNESCTAFLECSATSGSNVTYNWVVGSRTQTGRWLRYIFKEQDGETTFNCTISNVVSKKSAITTMTCSNNTKPEPVNFIVVLSVAGGCCLTVVIIVGIAVCVCHRKDRQAGSDSNDLTVYADITDVAVEDGSSSTMKPCSVYETIDNRVNSVTPGPQTVYDKIQLSRVRKASVSPYQEVP